MPSSLHLPSFLFFFFFFLALLICTTTSKTHPDDIQALRSIKSSVDPTSIPPSSCLSSWDFSLDPCDSSFSAHFTCGIRCDARTAAGGGDDLSRVTEIALDPAGYRGPLSPSVWSLPLLDTLDLADNRFSGDVPPPPPGVRRMLRRLSLSRNSFVGEMPDLSSGFDSLQEVSLDGNFLTGEVKVRDLVQVQRLELQSNNFTGDIPDLTSLPSLNYFDASDNNLLTGSFDPSKFPASTVEISIRNNRLSGDLVGPPFSLLRNLQVLDLSHNGLSGTVPSSLFDHPSLEQLTLSYNQFHTIQPPNDGGLSSQLVAIDLGHNGLTGLLPGFIGSMRRLTAVDLAENKFTGMIPVQYAMRAIGAEEMVRFERMVLKGNYLFGPIPGAMGAMKEGDNVGEVSLKDNCLFRCPVVFFFCEDGVQKPFETCRKFNPVIP